MEDDFYKVDSYQDFTLELNVPTEKVKFDVSTATAGSVGSLYITYNLSRDWLPYSWFVCELPKLNKDYAVYSTVDNPIEPLSLFKWEPNVAYWDTKSRIECRLNASSGWKLQSDS